MKLVFQVNCEWDYGFSDLIFPSKERAIEYTDMIIREDPFGFCEEGEKHTFNSLLRLGLIDFTSFEFID